jgi:hypothetical protein
MTGRTEVVVCLDIRQLLSKKSSIGQQAFPLWTCMAIPVLRKDAESAVPVFVLAYLIKESLFRFGAENAEHPTSRSVISVLQNVRANCTLRG